MATPMIVPKSLNKIFTDKLTNGGGAQTKYVAFDPTKKASLSVKKNSEAITISLTNSVDDASGTRLTDLESASVVWIIVDAGTTADYFKGDNTGVTGAKINGAPAAADVLIRAIQYGGA